MRDLVLYAHLVFGLLIIILSSLVLYYMKDKKNSWIKPLALIAAIISWLLLLPSAILYILFYPATKTLVKAGSWPWAHSILMETKEHWGIFIPFIATVAACLVYDGKLKESKKWWILLIWIAIIIGIMGKLIKIGALQ